ncbi:MAG: tyrosine-protein phosphatase [Planctomycetota bacterium]|jgi:protein-tyrosine phosphatase
MRKLELILYLAAVVLILAGCSSEVQIERSVSLQGQSNFRDIGGYETVDGRTVKTGVVYRSGELHALTGRDVQKLESLNIKTDVNFLTPQEIQARGADRIPSDTTEVNLPIEAGGGLVQEVSHARRTGDFSKVPADLNPKFHELLVDEARQQYAALIRQIIRSDGQPLVYHCSHGIHRTGTATAIILSAVGVPWDTVRQDYLLSNETRAQEIEKRTSQLRTAAAKTFDIDESEVDMTNINAFYILESDYIDGSLKQIEQKYGGIENYLKNGLGLSEKEINKLKEILL